MPRFYKILFLGVAFAAFCFLVFILWIQLSRYEIEEVPQLEIRNKQDKSIYKGQVLKIMLWNISYGGMPEDMDFFYSGGTRLMVSEEQYEQNFQSIKEQLLAAGDSLDILLLHKADTSSKRSYFTSQMQELEDLFPDFESSYCLNYSVPFIPVPLDQAIGEVHSGMLNFSRFKAEQSVRAPLNHKKYYWPKRLFTAQRCIQINSYPLGNQYLHIINAHLSSYDFQGEIRLSQLEEIWQIADSLEQRGDDVIIAGGWNMNPPGFKKYRIKYGYHAKAVFPEIDSSKYFKGWRFDYRMDLPTSRNLRETYRHGAISSSIKDFFICSPNIGVLEVNTADQRFKNSDHQAIYIEVFLK